MHNQRKIQSISGTAISVRGNDIDTDRIIPARFLKCISFDQLGPHAFQDDRLEFQQKGEVHPFDRQEFQGSALLFVNKNFGCGSSREHAPQSLMRWGIKAIIGESFAEIFSGNCTSLGIPCAVVPESISKEIMSISDSHPDSEWCLDIEEEALFGPIKISLKIPAKAQFLEGRWNPLFELITAKAEIIELELSLPY